MATALASTGRDIFYSICNWGNEQIASWGSTIANSWRTTNDIEVYETTTNQWQQLKANFLKNAMSADMAGSGGWNDPDMLQIGNSVLSDDEEMTHFALWALAKAPLIIGADLESIPPSSLAILKN